tara:strand:+ start:799 stop:1086 length:288 start_codon:yes stop_codon:yes gene_type:complete
MYDDSEGPKTLTEAVSRLRESIVWEYINSELYQESPNSNYVNWNEAEQKRYNKAALKVKRELSGAPVIKPKESNNELVPKRVNKQVKTLREYLAE